ncbi:MAG: LysR family transcriptional regulator [Nevskiales bacterium]
MKNIGRIELKLLVVFDAVFTERSASRAALRLGMTQPAISNALNRLRAVLRDPLFLRGPDGMRPTPRAIELATPVGHILRELEVAVEPASFVPAEARWSFRIGVAPQAGVVILPELLDRLQRAAPGVNMHVRPPDGQHFPALLDNDEVDLVITVTSNPPRRFSSVRLYEERYVAVMRRDHPLSHGRLSLQRFAAARHIMISHLAQMRNLLDDTLARYRLHRDVRTVVTDLVAGVGIIARTDLITGLFQRTLDSLGEFQNGAVVQRALPIPPYEVVMVWHEDLKNHPAHHWLRQQIIDIAQQFRR